MRVDQTGQDHPTLQILEHSIRSSEFAQRSIIADGNDPIFVNRESLGYLRVLIDRYDSAVEVDRVDRGSVLGAGDPGQRPCKCPCKPQRNGSLNERVSATDDFHGWF